MHAETAAREGERGFPEERLMQPGPRATAHHLLHRNPQVLAPVPVDHARHAQVLSVIIQKRKRVACQPASLPHTVSRVA